MDGTCCLYTVLYCDLVDRWLTLLFLSTFEIPFFLHMLRLEFVLVRLVLSSFVHYTTCIHTPHMVFYTIA